MVLKVFHTIKYFIQYIYEKNWKIVSVRKLCITDIHGVYAS